MPLADLDLARLRDTLALAQQAVGLSDPNPRVGCVIGLPDGRVLGSGFTQQAGGPHAEVVALQAARAAGHVLRGATAWVSLEPCAHHGRTPPCCEALAAAGIARVVAAVGDPNPRVAGQGFARLRAAGIAVELAPPDSDAAVAARELNIGFFARMTRGRPWVRLKIAASLDGRTALANGASQWITGEAARADGHAWRRRAGAVLTGVGTVRDDDPRLDVRLVPSARQPLRVVADSRLRTPPAARILAPPGAVLVVHAADAGGAAATTATAATAATAAAAAAADATDAAVAASAAIAATAAFSADAADAAVAARAAALQARGAALCRLPAPGGLVDLAALVDELARREVNELHVEAGRTLNGALLRAGLVDELLVYVAPLLIGAGRDLAALGPFDALADALRWRFVDVACVGDDLRLRARRPGER
ncbi:MAG: bifunctional diaminohydroxyphosphoribosylaminopyrimidine deaminase/5-amino-6-(5-phosphoribosylamino)uracil reductase RibD [Rubrivivax sp.]